MKPTVLYFSLIIGVLFLFNLYSGYHKHHPSLSTQTSSANLDNLEFFDPKIASQIMEQLYDYKPLDKKYINHEKGSSKQLDEIYLGLTQDEFYCQGVRDWVSLNAKEIAQKKRFVTDYNPGSLIRKEVIKKHQQDVMPFLQSNMADWMKEKVTYPHLFLLLNYSEI